MSKYLNGYLPKIEYWQSQYNVAKEAGNNSAMLKCLDKLTYFVQRQNEVYGEAGVGHS
jgi:hypothetical protein